MAARRTSSWFYRARARLGFACLAVGFGLIACSQDQAAQDEPNQPTAGAAGESSPGQSGAGGAGPAPGASGAGGGAGAAPEPLYVLANEIYADEESTSYVTLLSSLDVDQIDLDQAIEFPGGRATIATRAGWVFVAPPTSPEIRRFRVTEAGRLEPDGVVSFLDYGLDGLALDGWGNTFISDTKAYVHNLVDGTSVIWDPSDMTIVGEVDVSDFELVRPDLGDLNGSAGLARDGRLFRTIFWSNWDEQQTSTEQYLAVYDTDADKLIALEPETRCPGLSNLVSQDEAGNAYFSNWIWNVGETILRDAPKSCVLKLPADSQHFDPEFRLDYASLTQGREGAVFSYLADGRGVMSIFYEEESPVTGETTPNDLVSVPAWKVWNVDLNGDATPLVGLDWMLGAVTPLQLDGRSLLMVPGEDWSIIHVHEIVDAEAVPRFDIPGWSYQFLKVR